MSAPTLSRDAIQAAIAEATRDLSPHERVAVAERVARETARRRRRSRYPSPGVLAHKVDPLTTRETPALQLLDRELVACTEAMERGEGVRLAVFMPPQEGKSRRITIAFPLWLLLRNPNLRIAIASFESEIAAGFSKPIRDWITEHGSGTPLNPRSLADDLLGITLRGDSSSRSRFDIAGHTGSVVAVGMKGGLTSKAVDVLVVDDPYKNREQADNPKHRKMVEDWFRNVAIPRLPSAALVILVQTRWHPDDLGGYLIRSERTLPEHMRRWRFVNVPAQAERPPSSLADHAAAGWLPDSLGREPGQYLVSTRGRTPEDWAQRRAEVGEMTWGSLYQQRPTPPEGAVFAFEHITKHRRAADYEGPSSRRAVAVDTSAGGADEAGLIAGYRGTDGRVYVTHDRSGRMSSARWARVAWLLAVDTGADDLVWEANLAGPTMRQELVGAWHRIVQQVRTLAAAEEELLARLPVQRKVWEMTGEHGEAPGLELEEGAVLDHAALVWAATEQRLPLGEAAVTEDDRAELAEVWERMSSGSLAGALETPPCRLVAVHASVGKRARATPVSTAVETGKVSHVGVLPELEQELTQWQEGAASPGRLDAYVWLVTHLLGARRGKTTTSAAVTLPTGPSTR